MGAHLVAILAARGDQVSVTTRKHRESSENINFIHGNAREDTFLDGLLSRKWDAIVDFMVYSTPMFQQRASKLLSATDQYIFLSSARVYADSGAKIRENSPRLLDCIADVTFLATDEYSLSKARQENILHQSCNTNWTIIRPYITYSEQRLQLGVLEKEGWLYRALKGRTIVFSADLASKITTLTYGLDVANSIAALIGQPYSFGEAYHITQRNTASWNEILGVYLRVLEQKLGKRPSVMLLGLNDFSRCNYAEYQIKYDRMFDRKFDNKKIAALVDLDSFRPLEQGLTECLEEFMKDPRFMPIDWRLEAVKDRYSGEITSLNEIPGWKQKIKYIFYRFIKIKTLFLVGI